MDIISDESSAMARWGEHVFCIWLYEDDYSVEVAFTRQGVPQLAEC